MAENKSKPTMFIITGPNGAGKSTLYGRVLASQLKGIPFINADNIQKEEMQDASMSASYKAAEIATERRDDHLNNKKSFITETVFSHPSKLDLIKQAQSKGFKVVVYHVNVREANISVSRVANRLRNGGHDVPEDKIRERYERNKPLIKQAIQIADHGLVYDNSKLNRLPDLQISFKNGFVQGVSGRVPPWARDLYKDNLKGYSLEQLNKGAASYADIRQQAIELSKNKNEMPQITRDYSKIYTGKIVGESKEHYLQHSPSDNKYYAHFKSKILQNVKPGDEIEVQYLKNNSKANVEVMKIQEKTSEKLQTTTNHNVVITDPNRSAKWNMAQQIKQENAAKEKTQSEPEKPISARKEMAQKIKRENANKSRDNDLER